MLKHKIVNEWQKGLMELFGYIDPLYWSVLWVLAEKADEDGFCQITATHIAEALVRDVQRINDGKASPIQRLIKVGLIRIAKKRTVNFIRSEITGQVQVLENTPRILQLYGGIKRGRVPVGAERLTGLAPSHWRNGRNVNWMTHKLVRKKFKARKKP